MILTSSMAIIVQLAIIPADIQSSIDKAIATDDQFIIEAVTAKAEADNPSYAADIQEYITEKTAPEVAAVESFEPAAGVANAANDLANFWTEGWEGAVEGGLLVQTGNSENENLNGAAKLSKTIGDWEHILAFSAANNSSNDVRSTEEYRAGLQSRNNLSATEYVFGEFDWVKDRFSGYEYRLSEVVGYGHKYFDTDEFKLSAEAALGFQQAKRENGDAENNFLQRISGDLEWAINDGLSFTQHLSTEHANGTFFSLSKSALQTKISDSLGLKVGYEMEHISEVPSGTDKLDTRTMANIVYDF